MTKSRRTGFTIFALAMIISLLGLGTWQLQRLQWKLGLIKQTQAALTANPVSINDITAGIEYGYDVDRLRIRLTGSYRHDLERYVYSPAKAGLGYKVLTPFIDDTGVLVFVDRGWVPLKAKDPATRQSPRQPKGKITITGITRLHNPGLTIFQADADTKNNVWYWYDRETLAASLPAGVGETADGQLPIISPVFVQLEPGGEPGTGKLPIISPIKVDLPNNHLQYAITWYAMALIMSITLLVFLRTERSKNNKP